nr:MAG TPA: Protein of unknown function (DUF1056) [Microviridae sp.]
MKKKIEIYEKITFWEYCKRKIYNFIWNLLGIICLILGLILITILTKLAEN